MRRPEFSEAAAFFLGLWISAACAYAVGWSADRYTRTFPARLSAESIAGSQAVFFARTSEAFPPSGTEETLNGVRWRIRYTEPAVERSTSLSRSALGRPWPAAGHRHVTIVGESVPEGFSSEFSFERAIQ